MLTKVDDISSVKKVLHIEISESDIKKELDTSYNEIKKTANIKGFRKGKAPISMIEKIYGKDVKSEVIGKLIEKTFTEIITEKKLYVIGAPDIQGEEFKENTPYVYKATVEIKPDIEDIDINGINLKKTVYNVAEQEIEMQLKALQKRLINYEKIEKEEGVQKEDIVIVDIEIFKDGKHLEEKDNKNLRLNVGSDIIGEGFDENLISMKPENIKDILLKMPEDNEDKDLAGCEIVFKTKLTAIEKEILPEINDDFAKKLGGFNTLEDLEKTITNNLEDGYKKRSDQDLNEQIFTYLIDKVEFDVPDILIEHEKNIIGQETEQFFKNNNFPEDYIAKAKEDMAERFNDLAEKQAKRHILLDKIIEQESLKVSDEELEDTYKNIAESMQASVETVKEYYNKNEYSIDNLKHNILEKKALELILSKSNIEEVAYEEIAPEDEKSNPEESKEDNI
jgi:trigger factor